MTAMPKPTVFGAVIRYWIVVVLAILLGGIIGAGIAQVTKSMPTATAIVVVRDPRATGPIDGTAAARYAAEQVALIKSDLVLVPAQSALQLQGINISVTDLRSDVAASAPTDSSALRVTASDRNASSAAAIANEVVLQYRATLGDQLSTDATAQLSKIDTELAALQKQIPASGTNPAADLARAERSGLLSLRATVLAQLTAGDGVLAVSAANTPQTPGGHGSLARGGGLGATVGLLLGALIAALLANRKQRWESESQPAVLFDNGCIAEIRPTRDAHSGHTAFDTAAASMLSLQQRERSWSIGLVAGSGKPPIADTVLGLGEASARLARRVLVLIAPDAPVSQSRAQTRAVLNSGPDLASALPGVTVSTVDLGGGRELCIAVADVIQTESFLRRAAIDQSIRKMFDIVLVAIRLTGRSDVLLSTAVDLNVVALADHSSVEFAEHVAERLTTVSATTGGYLYLRGARRLRRAKRDRQIPMSELPASTKRSELPSALVDFE